MVTAPFVQAFALSVFPFLLAFAAASDLVTMTISNRVSLLLVAGFGVLSIMLPLPLAVLGGHLAAASIVLAVGFVLFALGWIGGGDAKLAAAISLWFGFEHTLDFAFVSAIFGGLLTLLIVLTRGTNLPLAVHRVEWLERVLSGRKGIPYGIALSAAALVIYPDTVWLRHLF